MWSAVVRRSWRAVRTEEAAESGSAEAAASGAVAEAGAAVLAVVVVLEIWVESHDVLLERCMLDLSRSVLDDSTIYR
jgi:hypothetical protein